MTPRPTPEECIVAACRATGISKRELYDTTSRNGPESVCRRIASILMRMDGRMSYPAIAMTLGLSSHASVHRAVNHPPTGSHDPVALELASAIAVGMARRRMQAMEREA